VKTQTKSIIEIKREIRDSTGFVTTLPLNEEVVNISDAILEGSLKGISVLNERIKSHYQQAVRWLLLQIRNHTILMEFINDSDLASILVTEFRSYIRCSEMGSGIIQEVDINDLKGLLLRFLVEIEKIFNRYLVDVFVYGTLMSNESRHYLIESNEFLEEDAIENSSLFDLGEYPMLVSPGNDTVFGECYRIPLKTLQLLDKIEGHPYYYQRSWCYLKSKRRAIVYQASQKITLDAPLIPDGRWSFSHEQAFPTTSHQSRELSLTEMISRQEDLDHLPLSLSQQYLWYKTKSESDCNVAAAYQIVGCLNLSVLDQSLRQVISRHSILRATFPGINGKPVQVVSLDTTLGLSVVDLQDFPVLGKQTHIDDVITKHFKKSFNIELDPLLCVKILLVSPNEYILSLTMHRLIADEWSLNIFVQEILFCYEEVVNERTISSQAATHQYTDFSRLQTQRLQGGVLECQLEYWKHQLDKSLTGLDIPSEQARLLPPDQNGQYEKQYLKISEESTRELKLLSEREGLTLFVILLSVLKLLLHRYTQSEDILVASSITNRNETQNQKIIGPLSNIFPIRTQFKDGMSFKELSTNVDQKISDISSKKDIPFDYLLDLLSFPHDNHAQHPLLQVKFTLNSQPQLYLKSQGLIISPLPVESVVNTAFALALSVEESDQELLISWEYNTGIYDIGTVERMMGHFQTLSNSVVSDIDRSITTLPLLTLAEQHQLLKTWNPAQPEYARDVCLHRLIEDQVKKSAGAVAVRFEGEELTYLELNQRANQLAHYLHTLGVTPETPVALCMEMSLDLAVAILGLLKAGGVYVPIEPTYPVDRISFILDDTKVSILLTQEKLVSNLGNFDTKVVCIDSICQVIDQESIENPVTGVTGENLAYILYTSGSTGEPKGVQLSHAVCCSRELWQQKTFNLTHSDRILMKSAWSSREFLWPLIVGAQVIMARSGGYQDTQYLAKLISEQQITIVSLVPSVLKFLLEEPNIETFTSLRHIISTGESISIDLQEECLNRLPAQLHNIYGLNEANYSTHWLCHREHQQQGKVPIGYPTDMQIYLLDRHLQMVPIGVAGEIHISGFGLAKGYFNRPNLNAERFIPNFLSTDTNSRLFKTGDLACYRSDGTIEYLGRLDYQVNIRGLRIELGEIEFVLRQHSAVQEAVVIEREDIPGEKSLTGYIVLNQDLHFPVNELRDHLKQKLPDYMIPAVFIQLDVLPMTPNGKISRLALPKPSRKHLNVDKPFVAPTSRIEKQIANLWDSVLKVDRISIHDTFFELGGYSLLAARIISHLHRIFGVELSLQTFIENPTIAELSIILSESI
jgi:amino acid adenylation domain-containing protein